MRRFSSLASVGTLLATLITVAAAAPARADVITDVPQAVDQVVDATNAHIFVTTGTLGTVRYFDLAGTYQGEIDLDANASDPDDNAGRLALGNNRIWVVTDDGIARVNPVSLVLGGTLAVNVDGAGDVGFAGDRVWYSDPAGVLHSVAQSDATDVRTYDHAADADYPSSPNFASEPVAAPNLLVTISNLTSPQISVWDLSTDPPVLSGTVDPGTEIFDTDLNPLATRLYYTANAAVTEVRLDTFAGVHTYTLSGVSASSVSADGSFVAATSLGASGDVLDVFSQGTMNVVRTLELGPVCQESSIPGSLSLLPGGTDIAVIVRANPTTVRVLEDVTTAGSQAQITIDMPASSPAPGDDVALTGSLALPGGGGASGRTLHVWRQIDGANGSSFVTVGDVTTSTGGSFTIADPDLVETGSYCYVATYEGDPSNASAWAIRSFDVARLSSSFTEAEASPQKAAPTDPVTLTGTFATEDGTHLTGQTITVMRDSGAGFKKIGEAITGAGGEFSFQDVSTKLGQMEYLVKFAGTLRYSPSQASAGLVAVARLDPRLRVHVSDPNLDFGQKTKLTVNLAPGADRREVKVFYTPKGGSRKLVVERDVPVGGSFTISHQPTANGVYEVVYAGNERYLPDADGARITVHAVVKGQMLGEYGNRNGYALYHANQSVRFRTDLKPPHPGDKIRIVWSYRTRRGTWRVFSDFRYKLFEGRVVVVYWPKKFFPAGVVGRVQASFGDADHALGTSGYDRFKVTK